MPQQNAARKTAALHMALWWHTGPAKLKVVDFNPSAMSRVVVRATNWLGDAVMSLPAIRAIRGVFPHAHLAVVARPWVADLYMRERAIDSVIPYTAKTFAEKRAFAAQLRPQRFDAAILLPNSFDSALTMWMAGIPERIGYRRDARGMLLTRAIAVPEPGDIPRHERFYYLELLRRAGMIERFPPCSDSAGRDRSAREGGAARLAELGVARPAIGISPGAAYGNAKRWLPERFAAGRARMARERGARVLVFGSAGERARCASRWRKLLPGGAQPGGRDDAARIHRSGGGVQPLSDQRFGSDARCIRAGSSRRRGFRRDGRHDYRPSGRHARVIREHAECSPCLLRECPIDHRCMTRVTADEVTAAALLLWQ